MTLLHLDSSVLGKGSVTRAVTSAIVGRITGADATIQVIYRDLVAEPLPYMTLATLPSAHPASAPPISLNEIQQAARHNSELVLEEFLQADIVVIGVPMYNFGVPTQLKSWIDAIVIPGKTFSYGPGGPIGLAGSKRIVAAIGRGSRYGTENFPLIAEHAETYLRSVLSFIGIAGPEIVVAEGVALDREAAINSAMQAVEQLHA